MNTVERLLALDAGTIEMPKKEITLKLGKLKGAEFTFECKAVSSETVSYTHLTLPTNVNV